MFGLHNSSKECTIFKSKIGSNELRVFEWIDLIGMKDLADRQKA